MELPDRAAPDPETETVHRQEQAHLQQLLQSLNPTDRAVLVLRYWQGCSEIEIAQALSLTVVLAPLALVLLIITILLIPVALVAVIAIALAAVFGWIAIGLEIGERFTKAIKQQWHPSLAAGLGTFLLALVANIIGLITCVGWLAPFLVTRKSVV